MKCCFILKRINVIISSIFSNFPEGCDNGCANHGNCVLVNNMYNCVCNDGWEGESCSVRLEMECNDEIDNDQGIPRFQLVMSKTKQIPIFDILLVLVLLQNPCSL